MSDITIRMAGLQDARPVYEIMHLARAHMKNPDAYITDDLTYIRRHITGEGFCLITEDEGRPVGFLMVSLPGEGEENLGHYLGFSPEKMQQVILMDSSAVLPDYQGRGLMGKMFSMAVEIAEKDYPILLGTVHPDNIPSRHNFEKLGFHALKTIVKPSGIVRLLMGRFREDP